MQKLVFFIDSSKIGSGSNIGTLYMNRFIIDEDAGHEIVKIYEVEEHGPFIQRIPGFYFPTFVEEKERLGVGHSIFLISNISLFALSIDTHVNPPHSKISL